VYYVAVRHYSSGGTGAYTLSITSACASVTPSFLYGGVNWTYSWTPEEPGAYEVLARAYNTFPGYTTTGPITVYYDPDYPEANITSPVAGEHVQGEVTVTGTASEGSPGGIESLVLDYVAGDDPTVQTGWQTILSSSEQVYDDTLALWDVSGLAEGPYVLRLTVSDILQPSSCHGAGRAGHHHCRRRPALGGNYGQRRQRDGHV